MSQKKATAVGDDYDKIALPEGIQGLKEEPSVPLPTPSQGALVLRNSPLQLEVEAAALTKLCVCEQPSQWRSLCQSTGPQQRTRLAEPTSGERGAVLMLRCHVPAQNVSEAVCLSLRWLCACRHKQTKAVQWDRPTAESKP